jgi:hypothetical protein
MEVAVSGGGRHLGHCGCRYQALVVAMTLNDTAAAYGLFQVVFADIADHVAVATFRLLQRSDPGLTFENVFRQDFTKTLKQFRQELHRFEGRSLCLR